MDDGGVHLARLRVVTMNLWGAGGDWATWSTVLRRGFDALDADLVTFQECMLTGTEDQAREILGDGYTLVHQQHRESDGQGVTTASRWPVRSVLEDDLPLLHGERDFAATALVTEIDAPAPWGRIWLVNYLPSWRLDQESEREAQAVHLAAELERTVAAAPGHVIVAGDLDADAAATSMRFWTGQHAIAGTSVRYRDAWEAAGIGAGDTFTPDNPYSADWDWPFRRIDHVLVRCGRHGGPTLAVAAAELVFDGPDTTAGDHFGIVTDLTVPPAHA